MENPQCKDCENYIQHYAFDKRKIFRVYCGHCRKNYRKRKYPHSPACEEFLPGSIDIDAFATKEYLSKELLQYMMRLDLLPPIHEAPTPAHKLPKHSEK